MREQRLPRLGQRAAAARAVQEPCADLGLQSRHLLGDRRGRVVQRGRRRRERAALRDRDEDPQARQVHRRDHDGAAYTSGPVEHARGGRV